MSDKIDLRGVVDPNPPPCDFVPKPKYVPRPDRPTIPIDTGDYDDEAGLQEANDGDDDPESQESQDETSDDPSTQPDKLVSVQQDRLVRTQRTLDLHKKNRDLDKKPATLSSLIRQFLMRRPDSANHSRLIAIQKAIYSQAIDPKSPKQIDAAKFLIERGFGKPKDEEGGSGNGTGGVQLVYVAPPMVGVSDVRGPVEPKPEFIDGEVME